MKIKLEWYEVASCAEVGLRRRIEAIRKGIKDAPGFNRQDKWAIDIEGACGEMAAAKAIAKYWGAGVNTFHAGDVGPFQVRTSRSSRPMLVVRTQNDPQDTFILVMGEAPHFEVAGWIKGREAMRKKYLRKLDPRRPEVYAVPPADLHPLEELDGLSPSHRMPVREKV